MRAALDAAQQTWGERGDFVLDTPLVYAQNDPVRKRDRRYELSDEGGATRRAGKPRGWLEVADRLVAADGFNVNRRGVVFVPVVEGRDLASLALRLADASRAVFVALLELRDDHYEHV